MEDNGSYVSNVFGIWNGITSKIGLGSLSTSNTSTKVRIYNELNPHFDMLDTYACTGNYDANGNIDWRGTWSYSQMYINKRNSSFIPGWYSPFVLLHNDLKEEIIAHEWGHVLSLDHYGNAKCSMSTLGFYAYPIVTPHDKQVLKAKYGS